MFDRARTLPSPTRSHRPTSQTRARGWPLWAWRSTRSAKGANGQVQDVSVPISATCDTSPPHPIPPHPGAPPPSPPARIAAGASRAGIGPGPTHIDPLCSSALAPKPRQFRIAARPWPSMCVLILTPWRPVSQPTNQPFHHTADNHHYTAKMTGGDTVRVRSSH